MRPTVTDQQPELCGCDEGRRATLSRRTLLGAAAAGAAAVSLSSSTQLAFGGSDYSGDTIVILSLRGGFDGLSAIAPIGDPEYLKARPNIAVPLNRAIKLDNMFGLHPALSPLKTWWDKGKFAAVHAVGQINPTRSHFQAMQDMENAAPGSSLRTGWLDRMVGLSRVDTFSSVAVGATSLPASMIGPVQELALDSIDQFTLTGAYNDDELTRMSKALRSLHSAAPTAVAQGATSTLSALTTTARLKAKGYTPDNGASYPGSELGKALRDLARLIKAGVGLRAATVDIGNWDMHVGLGGVDKGWMFSQLTDLGQSLNAFASDLGPKLDDVTLVTLSEFGRRVSENASGGVDHGHGNVSLILGGGLKAGSVYGRWPGLNSSALVDGDLAGTTDYRTVLAEVLEKRGKLSSAAVFPGLASGRLGVFNARS